VILWTSIYGTRIALAAKSEQKIVFEKHYVRRFKNFMNEFLLLAVIVIYLAINSPLQ